MGAAEEGGFAMPPLMTMGPAMIVQDGWKSKGDIGMTRQSETLEHHEVEEGWRSS